MDVVILLVGYAGSFNENKLGAVKVYRARDDVQRAPEEYPALFSHSTSQLFSDPAETEPRLADEMDNRAEKLDVSFSCS